MTRRLLSIQGCSRWAFTESIIAESQYICNYLRGKEEGTNLDWDRSEQADA
jgi:hypothetical protein